MENYWVTIPANGYGMSYKTQCNNATVTGKFCVPDVVLDIQYFEPYHLSADGANGSDADLYTKPSNVFPPTVPENGYTSFKKLV